MRRFLLVLVCATFQAQALTGCGSSTPAPPFTLACTTHRLPYSLFRAVVTVTNTGTVSGQPIIFGFDIHHLQMIVPAYPPVSVVVHPPQGSAITYTGFSLPTVKVGKKIRVFLRFARPTPTQSILVTNHRTVHITDSSEMDNPDCHIKRQV